MRRIWQKLQITQNRRHGMVVETSRGYFICWAADCEEVSALVWTLPPRSSRWGKFAPRFSSGSGQWRLEVEGAEGWRARVEGSGRRESCPRLEDCAGCPPPSLRWPPPCWGWRPCHSRWTSQTGRKYFSCARSFSWLPLGRAWDRSPGSPRDPSAGTPTPGPGWGLARWCSAPSVCCWSWWWGWGLLLLSELLGLL